MWSDTEATLVLRRRGRPTIRKWAFSRRTSMGRAISRRAICRRLQERFELFEKLVGELRVVPIDVRELDDKVSAEGG